LAHLPAASCFRFPFLTFFSLLLLSFQLFHFPFTFVAFVGQGVKEYANWPTFPQLYAGNELLGGCDIILEMHESGELKPAIQEMISA
jgi:hypothetical protein